MRARESNRRSVFCQPTIPPWGRGERSKHKLSVRYWEDPLDVLIRACQRDDDTGESFLNGVSRFLVDRGTGHKIAGKRTD